MPDLFVPLDANYADDEAIVEVGAECELLYVRSLALCKRLLNDGHLSPGQVHRLAFDLPSVEQQGRPVSELADDLVRVGLWERNGHGWIIPAWLKHNKSKAAIDAEREEKRAAGEKGNHARWHRNGPVAGCRYCDEGASRTCDTGGIAIVETETETETQSERGAANAASPPTAKKRGTRIPVPFSLSDADLEWFEKNFPGRDARWLEAETEKFVDFWKAKPGAGGVKLDWPATWRNWLRRASEGFG